MKKNSHSGRCRLTKRYYFKNNKGCTFEDLCNEFQSLIEKLKSYGAKLAFSYESIENLAMYSVKLMESFFQINRTRSQITFIKLNLTNKHELNELFKYTNSISSLFYLESVVGK
jgi:hypothetical protein